MYDFTDTRHETENKRTNKKAKLTDADRMAVSGGTSGGKGVPKKVRGVEYKVTEDTRL